MSEKAMMLTFCSKMILFFETCDKIRYIFERYRCIMNEILNRFIVKYVFNGKILKNVLKIAASMFSLVDLSALIVSLINFDIKLIENYRQSIIFWLIIINIAVLCVTGYFFYTYYKLSLEFRNFTAKLSSTSERILKTHNIFLERLEKDVENYTDIIQNTYDRIGSNANVSIVRRFKIGKNLVSNFSKYMTVRSKEYLNEIFNELTEVFDSVFSDTTNIDLMFFESDLSVKDLNSSQIYCAFVDRRRISERRGRTATIEPAFIDTYNNVFRTGKCYYYDSDNNTLILAISPLTTSKDITIYGFLKIKFPKPIDKGLLNKIIIPFTIANIESMSYYIDRLCAYTIALRYNMQSNTLNFINHDRNKTAQSEIESWFYKGFDFLAMIRKNY